MESESNHLNNTTISEIQDMVFGAISGIAGKVVEFPFDTVKVRLQTSSNDTFSGAFDCFRKTYHKEGLRGFYKGFSSPLFGSMIENGILFSGYTYAQHVIRQTTNRKEEDPLTIPQYTLAGGLAGMGAAFLLTPVELVKCKLQVQDVETLYHNINKETFTTNTVSTTTTSANEIKNQASSETSSKILSTTSTNNSSMNKSMAKTVKQTMSTKTKQATATTIKPIISESAATTTVNSTKIHYKGPFHVIYSTLQHHGIKGMYRGITGTLIREVFGGMAWFGVYELSNNLMIKKANVTDKDQLAPWKLAVSGGLAGIAYNSTSFPVDMIKSRMQTEDFIVSSTSKKMGKSFLSTAAEIYRAGGIRAFYKGCGITVARSAPSSGIIFVTYELLKRNFGGIGIIED